MDDVICQELLDRRKGDKEHTESRHENEGVFETSWQIKGSRAKLLMRTMKPILVKENVMILVIFLKHL